MKRYISLLLCLGLLVLTVLPASATEPRQTTEQTLTFSDMEGLYKTQGRTRLDGSSLIVDNAASGVEFNAYCVGDVTLALTAKCEKSCLYFTVIVDGERQRVELKTKGTAKKKATITLAQELTEGVHTFAVYRQTEVFHAICDFDALTLCGELLAPPVDSPLLLEFVGDSITAGYGVYTDLPMGRYGAGDPPFADSTVTYAYQTAQALGADLNVIATSGYGVVHGWGDDAVMPKMYPYTSWWRSHGADEDAWAFARPADIVVVNLGTNDAGTSKIGDAFTAGVRSFLTTIRESNPDAKIVWALGMMGTQGATEIQKAEAELGGESAGYYYVQLPIGTGGLNGHPNVEQQTKAGQTLAAFLRDTVLPADDGKDTATAEQLLAAAGDRTDDTAQLARLTAAGGGVDNAALIDAYYRELQSDSVAAWQWVVIGICGVAVACALLVLVWTLRKKKEQPDHHDS